MSWPDGGSFGRWNLPAASISVFMQFLHPVGVGREHPPDIGFREVGFREPPDGVHRVLRPDLALVHPLDGRGEFGRVVPEEFFGKPKAALVAQRRRLAKTAVARD